MPTAAQLDPTRTLTLRNGMRMELRRAFRKIWRAVQQLILVEDAFGLKPNRTTSSLPEIVVVGNKYVVNKRWKYKTQDEAADAFEEWLKSQVDENLLSPTMKQKLTRYIRRGFVKGANRALDDVNRQKGKRAKRTIEVDRGRDFKEGQREEFLRSTLGTSTAGEKLRLLQSQALKEVEGLSADLVTRGRRVLVDGLGRKLSPREIAGHMASVLRVSEGRARTVVNTELVKAHAEAQLLAMETLGVERVGVAVEWDSLASACKLCKPLDGIVLTIKEARGMLPRHPNCRCAWKIANVGEDKEEKAKQKRSKTKINKAIKQSQREGSDKDEWGPNREIASKRPVANKSFSDLLKELGML